MIYGLIGYPLTHSFSKAYFSEKFAREGINADYELFPLENIGQLPGLLREHPGLRGLNVTIPYKEAVIPYLDALNDVAEGVGAVNVIKIAEGRLTGYNSDVYGFEISLRRQYERTFPGHDITTETGLALILGTGGAAKSAAWVLGRLGIGFRFVSRNNNAPDTLAYSDLKGLDFTCVRWIINTTPLGTFPAVNQCPKLPFHALSSQHLVFDLIYNPAETLLLHRAKSRGCTIQNGLEMLHLQAEKAWEIWQTP
jgi:shikimate dehydrogenase